MNYPDTCKGLAYRISDGRYYITVSFVLERNLRYPELGFNFTETIGQGIVHSSQLTFLTRQDAQNFIDKYVRGTFYHPYIAQLSDLIFVRIDKGGDIPCYVSDACCEYYDYNNKLPKAVAERMETPAVQNLFASNDAELQAKAERAAKREENKKRAVEIADQVLNDLGAEESESNAWRKKWKLPLDIDFNNWSAEKQAKPYLELELTISNSRLSIGGWGSGVIYIPLSAIWNVYQDELSKNHWKPLKDDKYETMFDTVRHVLEPAINSDNLHVSHDYNDWFGIYPEYVGWTLSAKTDPDKLAKKILSYKDEVEKASKTFEDIVKGMFEEETIE